MVDAVIVGAGYAGPLMAEALARAGKRVLVLEAGPSRRMKDLTSSQIWSRGLHGPYSARSLGENPLGIGFNIGWGLGGSGLHHFAAWPRMHEVDFEMGSRFGRGLDWPIGYDDVRPYYDRVQAEFGVAGDAEAEVWRPPGEPYPLPPHELQPQARALEAGFAEIGLRTAPTPLAILSRPYKGRPACRYVAWCNTGCAIGALGHPLATVIPAAERAGAKFQTESRALRVLTRGNRAVGVEYADKHGRKHVQRARVVILASWAIEIPRILLNSGDGGVANSSGLVGKYMYPHVLFDMFGLLTQETSPFRGHVSGQLLCQDHIDPDPAKGYIGGYQWIASGAPKPNDLAGFANSRADINGKDLEGFLRRAARHLVTMNCMGYSAPRRDNALVLADERDEHGMRKAILTHAYDADAHAMRKAALEEGLRVLEAAGATEAWGGAINAAHIMGGAIMGEDPASSVASSYGQTHDVSNLFLAGASLFPGCGAVNPTFTLNALALRSAEYIERNWSEL